MLRDSVVSASQFEIHAGYASRRKPLWKRLPLSQGRDGEAIRKLIIGRVEFAQNCRKKALSSHQSIVGEARRLASQYQREADKCNTATETCEGSREQTQPLLSNRKRYLLCGKKEPVNLVGSL